ncbi:MAG: hypothetical protein AB2L11_02525 [Syntrophobacteraceae bacterium]
MGIRAGNTNGTDNAHNTLDREWAYRSMVSSNQQKLFQATLNKALPDGQKKIEQEINSLQREIDGQEPVRTGISPIAAGSGVSSVGSQAVGMDGLATSALLKLSALSPLIRRPMPRYDGSQAVPPIAKVEAEALSTLEGTAGSSIAKGSGRTGLLSARFESGETGVGAIGYDRMGGTSYGLYQISSRAGTMGQFLNYLEDKAPDLAARLNAAGRSNTGSRTGRMPTEWKKISIQEPERFEKLQHEFIEETHYKPAVEEILLKTGVDFDEQPAALQEVLWSTSVQHGAKGAANLFSKAVDKGNLNTKSLNSEVLINSIYSMRRKQFSGSTSDVQAAVRKRFSEEKVLALAMLADETTTSRAQA